MPVPDFQSLMLPVLKYSSSQAEHNLRDAVAFLADVPLISEAKWITTLATVEGAF